MGNSLKKTKLGKTGFEVSKLCYGTLSLSVYHAKLSPERGAELLELAYGLGVNFWDTAELYETYAHINHALKNLKYPEDIIISSRSYAKIYKEMEISIQNCLKETKKPSIEIFGLHEIQADEFDGKYFRAEAFRALLDTKKKGLIKAISVTTHSAKAALLASNIDEIDVIMPLINHKGIGIKDGTLEDMELAIKNAKEKGKGVFAMKILAGGSLGGGIEKAFNYALNNPYLDSAAVGMDCVDEIYFNVSAFSSGKFQENQSLKSKKRVINIEPWCIGCSSCIKKCPQGAISLEFGQAKVDHEKCILCGYCISACKDFFIKFLNFKEL